MILGLVAWVLVFLVSCFILRVGLAYWELNNPYV